MNTNTCTQQCYQHIRSLPRPNDQELDTLELVLFDMDGVLTDTHSSWRFIHTHFGVSNEQSVQAYVSGEIDDLEFIHRDVTLWRKNGSLINRAELQDLLQHIPLMDGAKQCMKHLHDNNVKTAIVSAGLDVLAHRVAKELGMDTVYANGIKTDDKGLLTTEGILRVPLMYKDTVVQQISDDLHIPMNKMAAVGNSCYDIPMLQKVSLRIAFNPSDDCICDHADAIIFGKNLEELLLVFSPYL